MSSSGNQKMQPPRRPDLAAQQLGSYRLLRVLGEGAMGRVYEAVHELSGQPAAIKVLSVSPDASAEQLKACFREAKAAAQLQHAGIVRIYDCAQNASGIPYIVMELLEGRTLKQHLKDCGPRSIEQAAAVALQIAQALAYAHSRGIVHRDIKPDNLYLIRNRSGTGPGIDLDAGPAPGPATVKILDFGVAKFLDNQDIGTLQTHDHKLLGTSTYMSPEQCLCAEEVGTPADVYSLGIVLYEMLCGRPPFQSRAGQVISLHVYKPPPPPTKWRSDLPEGLERLILSMLGKQAAERPDMAAVVAALQSPHIAAAQRLPAWRFRLLRARWAARRRLRETPRWLLGLFFIVCIWLAWNSEWAPPQVERPFFPYHNEHLIRQCRSLEKGELFFHKKTRVKDYVDSHADVRVLPSGLVKTRVYSASDHIWGAHIPGVVVFFDAEDGPLQIVSFMSCGVDRSRKAFGMYDDNHPRECPNDVQIDPAVVSKIDHARIWQIDRYEYNIEEFVRSPEEWARLRSSNRLFPVHPDRGNCPLR